MTQHSRSPQQHGCTLRQQHTGSFARFWAWLIFLQLLLLKSRLCPRPSLTVPGSALHHGAAGLWPGPTGWEGSSWQGHRKQSRTLNVFPGGRAVWLSGGSCKPGLTPLNVSLGGCGEQSKPSPGVCTREGCRDLTANGSAGSLGGRGRRFSCCSRILFFLRNQNLIGIWGKLLSLLSFSLNFSFSPLSALKVIFYFLACFPKLLPFLVALSLRGKKKSQNQQQKIK